MEVRIVNGIPYGPVQDITVTASPFVWMNPEASRVMVFVIGGTLNLIEMSPDGVTYASAGLSCNTYYLNPNWRIRVTYVVVAPTMQYTPA